MKKKKKKITPNCLLKAEYLIAIGKQDFKFCDDIAVIPTLPPDNAPREAPNRYVIEKKKVDLIH